MDLVSIASIQEENFLLQQIDEHVKASTSVWTGLKRISKFTYFALWLHYIVNMGVVQRF